MINPLKRERLLWGLTQDRLAAEAGVTHDNVVRNEQGLFNRPSPRLLNCLTTHAGLNSEKFILEYQNWVAWKRRQNPTRSAVQRKVLFNGVETLPGHPFLLWREVVFPHRSRIYVCQMLCCHPATVLKYETGKQRPMPSQIYNALIETGMAKSAVLELANLGDEYYRELRKRERQ